MATPPSDAAIAKWFEALCEDPLGQVQRLLAGSADVGRLRTAGPRDAARVLFGGLESDDERRRALEQGMISWLDLLRRDEWDYSASRKAFEAGEALAIIGRLRLINVISFIRTELDDWFEWAIDISRQQKFDALADMYSALALTQRGYAERTPGKAFGLEPLWLDLCRGAGSRFPAAYLGIGMIGLRSLPERMGAVNDQAWLQGLIVWAEEQEPTLDDFAHQWRAMCALYPRAKRHWKTQISYALRDATVPLAIADYWKHEIGLSAEFESNIPVDPIRASMSTAGQLAVLLERLDAPISQIEGPIRADIAARENYAHVTGFSYYLTTTCCNIGMRLLESAPDSELKARGQLAAELALKSLRWSPDNVFGWALWRDALEAQSLLEAAELVGWESIRRYPENSQWRTQLALLFVRSNRVDDAERLLLEARRRFPAEPAIVSILAELMLARGDLERAKEFADDGLAFEEPTNAAFSVGARLAFHTSGAVAALEVLDRGMRHHPGDPGLPGYRATIVEGAPLPLYTMSFRAVAVGRNDQQANNSLADIPKSTRRGGALRRIASKMQQTDADRAKAAKEVRAILADAPNNEYAKYMDSSLSELIAPERTTFAERLKEAVTHGTDSSLADLGALSPERMPLVEMVRAVVLRDFGAASGVLSWLRRGAQREARSVAALRGFVLGRLAEGGLFSIDDLSEGMLIDTLAANDNFPIDIIEASLAPRRILLAA